MADSLLARAAASKSRATQRAQPEGPNRRLGRPSYEQGERRNAPHGLSPLRVCNVSRTLE